MDPAIFPSLGHLAGRKAGVRNTLRVCRVLEPAGMPVSY